MPQIELTTVQSSRIAAMGYSEENCILAIRFPPTKRSPAGKLYHYEGVNLEKWKDFQNADSLGGYFAKHILNNPQHPFRCVDEGGAVASAKEEAAGVVSSLSADAATLKVRAIEVSQQVKTLVIHSAREFAEAGNRLKQIVLEKKQAQLRVNQIKTPAYQTYKAALQLEKDVMTPYAQAEQWIKSGMGRYLTEEEAERHKREAVLTSQARHLAEEEARQQAEELAALDVLTLELQGEPELAAQVRQNPASVAPARVFPVVLQKDVPKVEGVSSRRNWSFRIIDEAQLPREYLMPNESAIRQVVKALKDKANIPGVEVYCEDSVAVRA